MICLNIRSKTFQRVLLTATAISLFVGTQEAFAGGGGQFGDHGGMGAHAFGDHNELMNSHDAHADRNHDGIGSSSFRSGEDRHQGSDQRAAKMTGDRGKGNAPGVTATGALGTSSKNTIHPIVTSNPMRPPGHPSTGTGKDKAPGPTTTSTSAPTPGATSNSTIHPIVTNSLGQPAGNAPTIVGRLPSNDPVGNTHPMPGPNPPTVVTVSNGVTTTQIQNGPGGVAVYSDKPGTITITNGKESTTLPGGSVTLSGNVVGVGHGEGVEVGPRNGEGKTVVAVKPPPPPPAAPTHVTGGPEGGFFGALGSSIKDGIKAVGNGVEDGAIAAGKGIADVTGLDPTFKAGPVKIVPPPSTSTVQQQ